MARQADVRCAASIIPRSIVLFQENGGIVTTKLIDYGCARKRSTGSADKNEDYVSSGAAACSSCYISLCLICLHLKYHKMYLHRCTATHDNLDGSTEGEGDGQHSKAFALERIFQFAPEVTVVMLLRIPVLNRTVSCFDQALEATRAGLSHIANCMSFPGP